MHCENNYGSCECNSRCACLQKFRSTHDVTGATQLPEGCPPGPTCVQLRARCWFLGKSLRTSLLCSIFGPAWGNNILCEANVLLFYAKYGKGLEEVLTHMIPNALVRKTKLGSQKVHGSVGMLRFCSCAESAVVSDTDTALDAFFVFNKEDT